MDPTARFAELVRGTTETLTGHLDEAALCIAAHARAGLDVREYLARLEAIAAASDGAQLGDLTDLLFESLQFRGNTDDYYDPGNSYLDRVVDRRLGIPITLAVVLMETGRRIGIPLSGVGMPGHFLVRHEGEPPVYLDPFDGGRLMSEGECVARFHAVHGPATPFDRSFLEPIGPHAILARMLANLRQIHLARQDSNALEWVLRLHALLPGATIEERSERAGVLIALARFDEAADVLDELSDVAVGDRADELARKAKRLRARLN